jgi:MFS family permease
LPKLEYRWFVVLMLWAICFFNYADRQAIFSVFPLLGDQLHLNTLQLGMLGSAFAWVYALAAPWAGTLVDRIRKKAAILIGLEAWSVICMATALAPGFPSLLALRGLEGLGESIYFPASMAMISAWHGPNTRSRALGLHQTSVYIGTIAGGFFAGWIGERYGWRLSFLVFGGLGCLLGLALQRVLREPTISLADLKSELAAPMHVASPHSDSFLSSVRLLLATPTALILMISFACANFVAVVLLAWMPSFLYSRFHMSLAIAGLAATAVAQISSMVGSAAGGVSADFLTRRIKAGRILVQAAGVLCGAPFVLLCGLTHSPVWLVFALCGWGFGKGLYDANIFASLFDVIPAAMRGRMTGMMNAFGWLIGGSTAPVLVGYVALQRGLGTAIALSSAVYLLAAACLILAAWRLRHDIAHSRTEA